MRIETFTYDDGREFTEDDLKRNQDYSYNGSETKRNLGGVDTVVIHSMYALGYSDQYSPDNCRRLLESYEVSAHFLIGRRGDIWQMVELYRMAWHAPGYNKNSVGIELISNESDGFTKQQYQSLIGLVGLLIAQIPTITQFKGHQEIDTTHQKTDPWNFEWERFFKMLETKNINLKR